MASALRVFRPENWVLADWVEGHVCGNIYYFRELERIEPVEPGRRTFFNPIAKGTVVVQTKRNGKWENCTLTNVAYIPGSPNLVSLSRLQILNFRLQESNKRLKNISNSKQNIELRLESNEWLLKFLPVSFQRIWPLRLENIYKTFEIEMIKHLRLAHGNQVPFPCKFCIENPAYDRIVPNSNSNVPAGFIYAYQTPVLSSKSGHIFSIILLDKSTGYSWAFPSKGCLHATKQINEFCKLYNSTFLAKVHSIKFANAVDEKLFAAFQYTGVKRQVEILPFERGVDEEATSIFNAVIDRVGNILTLGNLPQDIWNMILYTSVYIQNIIPTNETTPYELLKKHKPSLDHLRILGSIAIPFNHKQNKVGTWVLIGYTDKNSYILYNKLTCNMIFGENALVCEEEKFLDYIQMPEQPNAWLFRHWYLAKNQGMDAPAQEPSAPQADIAAPADKREEQIAPATTLKEPGDTNSQETSAHYAGTKEPADTRKEIFVPQPDIAATVDTREEQTTTTTTLMEPAVTTSQQTSHAGKKEPADSRKDICAPAVNVLEAASTSRAEQHTSSKTFLHSDIKFIFENLMKVDLGEKKLLCNILEPFQEKLQHFEMLAKTAVPYSNTSRLPRSFCLDDIEILAKSEFEALRTKRDGNCMYHSICLTLFASEDKSLLLRLLMLNHIIENWDILAASCYDLFTTSLRELNRQIVCVNTWGTATQLYILSEILELPIYSIQITSKNEVENHFYNSNPLSQRRSPIYLFLRNRHFEALVPKASVIIKSINANTVVDFFNHITHKYVYSRNKIQIKTSDHKFEKVIYKSGNPAVSQETKEGSPPIVDLTDLDEDGVEKVLKCVKCRSTNKRLNEVFARNAELEVLLREKTSFDKHRDQLPIIQCTSCADLAQKIKSLESELIKIRQLHNKYGECLIKKIGSLESELFQERRRVKDLKFRQTLYDEQLEIKITDKMKLQQELVTLANELQKHKDYDEWFRIVGNVYNTTPPTSGPPPTPGRNSPSNNVPQIDNKNPIPASNSPSSDLHSGSSSHSTSRRKMVPPEISITLNEMLDTIEERERNNHSEETCDVSSTINSPNSAQNMPSTIERDIQEISRILNEILNAIDERETNNYSEESSSFDLAKDLALSSSASSNASPWMPVPDIEPAGLGNIDDHEKNDYSDNKSDDEQSDDDDDSDNDAPAATASRKIFNLKLLKLVIRRINLKKLQCRICSKIFSSEDACLSHLKHAHNIKGVKENDDDDDEDDSDDDDDSDPDDQRLVRYTRSKKTATHEQIKKADSTSRKHKNADRRPNDDPVCRICGARYMSIEDLAFHLASQHKPDKKQKKRSKPKTAPTPVSKKPLVPSNSSAANQKSGPITFEPLPQTKSEHRQGFRLNNAERSKSFEIRFPIIPQEKSSKQDAQKPTSSTDTSKTTKKRKNSPQPSTSKAGNLKAKKTPGKKYKCKQCDKSYTANGSLKRHMETHTSRFPCRCGKDFTTHEGLKVHCKRFHSRDRTQHCRFCSKTLKKSEKAMRTHEMTQHYQQWLDFLREESEHEADEGSSAENEGE